MRYILEEAQCPVLSDSAIDSAQCALSIAVLLGRIDFGWASFHRYLWTFRGALIGAPVTSTRQTPVCALVLSSHYGNSGV